MSAFRGLFFYFFTPPVRRIEVFGYLEAAVLTNVK